MKCFSVTSRGDSGKKDMVGRLGFCLHRKEKSVSPLPMYQADLWNFPKKSEKKANTARKSKSHMGKYNTVCSVEIFWNYFYVIYVKFKYFRIIFFVLL